MRGKLIAIYGINNIGKSTQTNLLVQRLMRAGIRVEYIKYPIYDLDPTGKMLNEILRGKKQSMSQAMMDFFPGTKVRRPSTRGVQNNTFRLQEIKQKEVRQKVSEEELQMWYSLNRYQYEPQLKKKLDAGITIMAEDYTGTGLAWGSAKGADLSWLENVNKFLTKPDIEVLMDGERFLSGKEEQHIHESSDRLIGKAQTAFRKLAKKYDWKVVPANRPIQDVAEDIWTQIIPLFERRSHELDNWLMAPMEQTQPE